MVNEAQENIHVKRILEIVDVTESEGELVKILLTKLEDILSEGETVFIETINSLIPPFQEKDKSKILEQVLENLEIEELSNEFNANLLSSRVQLLFSSKEYRKALVAVDREIALRQKMNDTKELANAIHSKAVLFQVLGEVDRANTLYSQALDVGQQVDDPQLQDRLLYSLANINLHYLGNFEKAYSFYDRALEIAREGDNSAKEAFYLDHLGMARYWQQDYDEAITQHKQAWKVLKSRDRDINVLFHKIQLAMAYMGKKEYENVIDELLSVSDLKINNTDTYSNTWYLILLAELTRNKPDLVAKHKDTIENTVGTVAYPELIQEAKKIADENQFIPAMVLSRLYWCRYLKELGRGQFAEVLSEAKELAVSNNRYRDLKMVEEFAYELDIPIDPL